MSIVIGQGQMLLQGLRRGNCQIKIAGKDIARIFSYAGNWSPNNFSLANDNEIGRNYYFGGT